VQTYSIASRSRKRHAGRHEPRVSQSQGFRNTAIRVDPSSSSKSPAMLVRELSLQLIRHFTKAQVAAKRFNILPQLRLRDLGNSNIGTPWQIAASTAVE